MQSKNSFLAMPSGRQLDEIKVRANEDNECLHSDCRVQLELDEVNAMKTRFLIAEAPPRLDEVRGGISMAWLLSSS